MSKEALTPRRGTRRGTERTNTEKRGGEDEMAKRKTEKIEQRA